MTAKEIIQLLRIRFNGKDTICLEQVRNGTGFISYPQTIDFVVIQLWPSRGLTRSAMEIKVSRQDFLRELQNPNKNSDFKHSFHEFWYVTDKGVVNSIDEIPDNMGWLEVRGNSQFTIKKMAKRKEDAVIDDLLLASLCRAMENEKFRAVQTEKDKIDEHPKLLHYANAYSALEKFLISKNQYLRSNDNEENILNTIIKASTTQTDKDIRAIFERLQDRLLESWQLYSLIVGLSLEDIEKYGREIMYHNGNDKDFGILKTRIENLTKKKYKDNNPELVDTLVGILKELSPNLNLNTIQEKP